MIDWRQKDSDRWIGRSTDGHLLCVQRTDRKRWSWKITPPGGGAVLRAGIERDAESAKKSAQTSFDGLQNVEAVS